MNRQVFIFLIFSGISDRATVMVKQAPKEKDANLCMTRSNMCCSQMTIK